MTPIRTNKPLFFNSSGEPLNGTIWIGQPNQDPRTNTKTVTFRDAGGSEFTAAQPLTTINGRIVYNGKPIVALVDGEHSMLIFDSSGAQVDYSRSVSADTAGEAVAGFSELTRVGLTLSEIKGFDVAVGDTVENIGKVTAQDGLGESWLAVSATGSPADDETLIDFTNGLQGRVITNKPDYQEATVELGNQFASGSEVKVIRHGDLVTVTGVQTFFSYTSSLNQASSNSGVIPTWARPSTGQVRNAYYFDPITLGIYVAQVTSGGTFIINNDFTDSGTTFNTTTSGTRPIVSYSI